MDFSRLIMHCRLQSLVLLTLGIPFQVMTVNRRAVWYYEGPVCDRKHFHLPPKSEYLYYCSGRQLHIVPSGLDSSAISLDLNNNNLTKLFQGELNHLENLETLKLQYNQLFDIEPGAFNGLMQLTNLGLSGNLLKNIDGQAFFTLPSLTFINMTSSNLTCGCQERLLQEFVNFRNLSVEQAHCGNFGKLLSSVWTTLQCGSEHSLFSPFTSCYLCVGAAGIKACGWHSVQTCSTQNSVCYNHIEYSTYGHLVVSGGCEDYSTCLSKERGNMFSCRKGQVGTCHICHRDMLANDKDAANRTKEFDLTLLMTLNGELTPELQDSDSTEYSNFVRYLHLEVGYFLLNKKGAFNVSFIALRPPNITVALRVHCATIWFISHQEVMDEIEDALLSQRLKNLNVILVRFSNEQNCDAEKIQDAVYGTFNWQRTNAGTVAFIKCPFQLSSSQNIKNASRLCEQQSNGSGLWKAPLVTDCPFVDDYSRELQSLSETDINDGNVVTVAASLRNISSKWNRFQSFDVDSSVTIIDKILDTELSRDGISDTIDSINNLLNVPQNILAMSEDEYNSSKRLVQAVESVLTRLSLSQGDYVTIKENIACIVTAISGSNFGGLSLSVARSGKASLVDRNVTYKKGGISLLSQNSGIVLPQGLLKSSPHMSTVERMSLTVFRDPKLFSSITKGEIAKFIPKDGKLIPAKRTINSYVISATVPGVTIKDLSLPVVVALHHFNPGQNISCVFWDSLAFSWDTDGCTVNATNEEYTICHCDHLTNFALLMDVYSVKLSASNKLALQIISYVGCGLSLFGVCLTLITYLKFRKLRRDNPAKILMNLCLSIGCLDIVFLFGVQSYTSSSTTGCKAVGVLLHYFLLSAMSWMVVEAFYMYMALIKIFDTNISRFALKSALFGWGVPLLIVAITLGVNKSESYGLQPGGICWLDRIPFFVAFLAPVCLVLLLNSVTFFMVLRQIVKRSSSTFTKRDSSITAVRVRGAIVITVLLGLTWAFAFLAVGDFGIVFQYLFAILNTLQGLFLFIFYCLMKKEAQQSWRKTCPCLKSPYVKNIS